VRGCNVIAWPAATFHAPASSHRGSLRVEAGISSLNLKALEVPTHADDGIDVSALAKALATQPVAACLLGSSFNNPLGSLLPQEKKRALLALLARHHVPLIEDDTYGDIYFGPQRPRPFSAHDPQGNTIYCSSFSKTIAPGWRIGWMVPGRHMQEVLDRKFAGTLCGPALSQAAFAEYLQSGGYDRHLRRIRNEFAQGLRRMTDVIAKEFPPGTRVSRPSGGFVLWVELDRRARTRDLLQSALKRGICFAPGEVFSAQGHYAHCLRISCGYGWSPQVEKALRTLAHLTHRHLQEVIGNRVSGTGARPSSVAASFRT
jgi:DNA-binding transcriptional MocR family regulator